MKKVILFLGAVCLLSFSSCCNKSDNQQVSCGKEVKCCQKEKKTCGLSEEAKQECKVFAEKWAKFDDLTVEEQKELIAKKKAFIDQKREELKAKIAECEKRFEGFDALSIAEQKAVLDEHPCCRAKSEE